jgi:hypothetical protein
MFNNSEWLGLLGGDSQPELGLANIIHPIAVLVNSYGIVYQR